MRQKVNFWICTWLIALVSFGAVSCKKDESSPDVVTNPLDEEAYYLIGKVTANSTALADVSVSITGGDTKTVADGTFQLKVSQKGDYNITFSKSGYVTVTAVATIESSSKKNESVAISQEMTATNPPVTVTPDAAVVITDAKNSALSLAIPAGAVKQATPISVTEFKEGAKKTVSGQTRVSLSTLNCEPDGTTFEKAVTVKLKNPVGGTTSFSNLKHYVEKNGVWSDGGTAAFDASTNTYAYNLNGFSNHSLGVSATVQSAGTTTEALTSIVIDNLGNMSAKEQAVSVNQKIGWAIDGDLNSLLKASLPTLSDAEVTSFASIFASAIASQKGSPAGISEATVSMGTAKVSGDTKLTLVFTSTILKTNMIFALNVNGSSKNLSIPVKTYNGVAVAMNYEQGSSYPDHSGGSGN